MSQHSLSIAQTAASHSALEGQPIPPAAEQKHGWDVVVVEVVEVVEVVVAQHAFGKRGELVAHKLSQRPRSPQQNESKPQTALSHDGFSGQPPVVSKRTQSHVGQQAAATSTLYSR